MNNKFKKIIGNKENVFTVIIFALFVFMMIFRLTHSALWGDEWTEYNYSQASIADGNMYHAIISTFQPPLYNFLMHFWLGFNQSVLWFRFFNVILGCISGIFLFITLENIYNGKTAKIVLCLLAVCYQWIYCIQECSEYALMLTCLFGAICFYVLSFSRFMYKRMMLFIIFCVLAIYSQYGAVFVALPLLLLYFIGNIVSEKVEKKRIICLISSYIISLFAFAVPLYIFFLKQQMASQQISGNKVKLTVDLLRDFPFTIGNIIGYLYNINSGDIWPVILSAFGIVIMTISIFLFKKKEIGWIKLSLIAIFWIGYIAHYFSVQLHIYAMVHPNLSSGFFARYSYFYIPILSIVLPIIAVEFIFVVNKDESFALFKYITGVLCFVGVCLSLISILCNWNKALDDRFAKIWMENEGWKDTTYLYGMAKHGFRYYVSHSDGYQEGYLNNALSLVDNNNLPLKFWAWRTNWGGDGWITTIDTARSLGYTVTVYDDSGYTGQLAYCSYDKEIDEFMKDEILLNLLYAGFEKDGKLHVQVDFRNPSASNIEYNVENYKISYHLLDFDRNIILWNNEMIPINRWVNYNGCEIVVDPIQIEQTEYIVQVDAVQEEGEWISDSGKECPVIKIKNGAVVE